MTRRHTTLLVLGVLLVLLSMVSMAAGRVWVPLSDWLNPADPRWSIIFELRLPRTILAVAVGAALGMAGAAMQGYTRNPLADPGALGVSSMGALGAVLRESDEEIALDAGQVVPLGYLDPLTTITGFRVTPVVAVIDPDYVPRPDPDEVDEVFEVPFEFLMAPSNLRQVQVQYNGRPRHLLEYDWPGHRIWGATAAILYNLRRRLEQAG